MSTSPDARRSRLKRADPVLLGCLAAVLLPFLVGLVRVASLRWTPTGDWALLELRTRSVGGAHTPLVGAYSRFGWSHPGPALFYALAIPYRLLGDRPSGMLVAALLVNAVSVAGIVLLAWRRGGRVLTFATAIGVVLVCHALGALVLRDPWNPSVTVLPFALLVFLAWAIACGDSWMLPVAAFVASFVVQSHVGYAALVVVALVVAIGWRVVDVVVHRNDPDTTHNARRARLVFGVSAIVAVAAWLPPLIDQIVNPGNIDAIMKFFGKHHATPSNNTAFRVVGRALAVPGAWVTGHDTVRTTDFTATVSGFFFPVALLVMVAGFVYAMRRRERDALALLTLMFAVLFAAVYSVSRIAGPLAGYLVRWLMVLGMISWVAAGWALWPWLRRAFVARGARAALVVAGVVALVVPTAGSVAGAVRARAPWYRAGLVEQQLARDTVAHLHTGGRPVLLESDDEHWWTWGLAPRLEAAGIPVAARKRDVLYYGRHRVVLLDEARVAVVIVTGPNARTTDRPAGGRLLAYHAGQPKSGETFAPTENQNRVLKIAELGLLDDDIAVYEVPL